MEFIGVSWRKASYSGSNNGCVEVGTWRKASYSGTNGNCVEVRAWRKASHSGNNGNCVEVAPTVSAAVAVRDSKNRRGPVLAFAPGAWSEFTGQVKAGAFDLT